MRDPIRGVQSYKCLVAGRSTAGAAGGVVAVAGSRDESAAAAWRNDFHLHGAERAIAPGVGRIVGQRVLIANVVRDLLADAVHVFDILREIRKTARGFGDFFERASCALGAFFAFFAQQTDGVDDRIGLLDFANRFLKRIMAGIVFAIRDDQEHLLVPASLLHMVKRANDGVVQRGAAARIDALQSFL